jgi:hypothetical protein
MQAIYIVMLRGVSHGPILISFFKSSLNKNIRAVLRALSQYREIRLLLRIRTPSTTMGYTCLNKISIEY